MIELRTPITGGCLCGALRYEAASAPLYAGYCCCSDCRKVSGSGFVPFMGFSGSVLRFTGEARQYVSKAARGGEAVRNWCPRCGGLVFGGRVGLDEQHSVYAGSLDDTSWFQPTMAIFTRDRPVWVSLPVGLKLFQTLPD